MLASRGPARPPIWQFLPVVLVFFSFAINLQQFLFGRAPALKMSCVGRYNEYSRRSSVGLEAAIGSVLLGES